MNARTLPDRRTHDYCVWTDRRQAPRRASPLGDEIDRLREVNRELMAALERITQHACDSDTNHDDLLADFEHMRDIASVTLDRVQS